MTSLETIHFLDSMSNEKSCDIFELCNGCTSQNSANVALRQRQRSVKEEVSLIFDTTCHNFFDAISSKKANLALKCFNPSESRIILKVT